MKVKKWIGAAMQTCGDGEISMLGLLDWAFTDHRWVAPGKMYILPEATRTSMAE
jgi:hypothetical protein